jgi:hypothetical protein
LQKAACLHALLPNQIGTRARLDEFFGRRLVVP